MLLRSIIATVALTALCAAPSRAGVIINVQQSGNDVVATASGTINTAGFGHYGEGVYNACLVAGTGWGGGDSSMLSVGIGGAAQGVWWDNITGPFPFSTGPVITGTSGTGDPVGIGHLANSSVHAVLYTPIGYTSGSPLEGTAIWANETISSLDLIPGSYRYTWGSGLTADSLTINIVPEPAVVALAGLGAAALMILRRREHQ